MSNVTHLALLQKQTAKWENLKATSLSIYVSVYMATASIMSELQETQKTIKAHFPYFTDEQTKTQEMICPRKIYNQLQSWS